MVFSKFLKGQFTDYIDVYQQHFRRTIGVCIGLSALVMVSGGILFACSNNLKTGAGYAGASLLNSFYAKYSTHNEYNFTDAIQPLLFFFIALFSIALLRRSAKESQNTLFKQLSGKDILVLLLALFIACVGDWFMAYIERELLAGNNHSIAVYIISILYYVRLFLPQLLFGYAVGYLANIPAHVFRQRFFALLAALWVFNQVAHATMLLVRGVVFDLVLLPFSAQLFFLFESILGILLIACCFLGFYSSLTYWMIPPANDTEWDILQPTPNELAEPTQPRL